MCILDFNGTQSNDVNKKRRIDTGLSNNRKEGGIGAGAGPGADNRSDGCLDFRADDGNRDQYQNHNQYQNPSHNHNHQNHQHNEIGAFGQCRSQANMPFMNTFNSNVFCPNSFNSNPFNSNPIHFQSQNTYSHSILSNQSPQESRSFDARQKWSAQPSRNTLSNQYNQNGQYGQISHQSRHTGFNRAQKATSIHNEGYPAQSMDTSYNNNNSTAYTDKISTNSLQNQYQQPQPQLFFEKDTNCFNETPSLANEPDAEVEDYVYDIYYSREAVAAHSGNSGATMLAGRKGPQAPQANGRGLVGLA